MVTAGTQQHHTKGKGRRELTHPSRQGNGRATQKTPNAPAERGPLGRLMGKRQYPPPRAPCRGRPLAASGLSGACAGVGGVGMSRTCVGFVRWRGATAAVVCARCERTRRGRGRQSQGRWLGPSAGRWLAWWGGGFDWGSIAGRVCFYVTIGWRGQQRLWRSQGSGGGRSRHGQQQQQQQQKPLGAVWTDARRIPARPPEPRSPQHAPTTIRRLRFAIDLDLDPVVVES